MEHNPYSPPGATEQTPGSEENPWIAGQVEKLKANLRILGWVQVGFGALGTLGVLFSQGMLKALQKDPAQQRLQHVFEVGTVGTWMEVSRWVGVVLALTLLGAGICLLKGRLFGRQLSFAHAGGALVMTLVGFYMNVVYVFPALTEMAKGGGPIAEAGARGGMIGGIMGTVFALVLPAVEVWMCTRPGIKSALS